MTQPAVSYKRHRFPPQIIAHAVWLYYGVVTLFEVRTRLGPVLTVSDELATDGFPVSHGLQSVIANLVGRRFRVTWNEEVADGGEQRNEML